MITKEQFNELPPDKIIEFAIKEVVKDDNTVFNLKAAICCYLAAHLQFNKLKMIGFINDDGVTLGLKFVELEPQEQ